MDTVCKAFTVITIGLTSYLIPSSLVHKSRMKDVSIIRGKLEEDSVGVKDMLVATSSSDTNRYVVRRDTVTDHSVKGGDVSEKTATVGLRSGDDYLTIDGSTVIVGVRDIKKVTHMGKEIECMIEGVEKSDSYIVALSDKTGKVVGIASDKDEARLTKTLKRGNSYYDELWVVTAVCFGVAVVTSLCSESNS